MKDAEIIPGMIAWHYVETGATLGFILESDDIHMLYFVVVGIGQLWERWKK